MSRSEPHRLRKAIQEKRPAIGLYLQSGSPRLFELLGYLGLDYIVLEMEHFNVDLATVERIARSAALIGVTLLVRVPKNDFNMAQKALDNGANGIVFPRLSTKQDALAAVSATKYAPIGKRGWQRSLKAVVEKQDGLEYSRETNEDVILMPLIEEAEGVRNIDEILSVEGIDAIDTGPGDLSYTLGVPTKWHDPKVLEALNKIYDACAKRKIPFTITFPYYGEEVMKKYLNKGFSLLFDLGEEEWILTKGLKEQLAIIKSVIEHN